MTITMEEIDDLQKKVNQLEHQFLCESGWAHTNKLDGCLWFWGKKTENGLILVGKKTALVIQADEDFKKGKDQNDVK